MVNKKKHFLYELLRDNTLDLTPTDRTIVATFYTFLHFKRRPNDAKNKKKCKINSRNFTYDGLTFSSSFLLEDVKDEI